MAWLEALSISWVKWLYALIGQDETLRIGIVEWII